MKIIVIDTETTGLDPLTSEILEIAIVGVDLNTLGHFETLLDTLVRPVYPDWTDCWFMQHSGLAPELWDEAPSMKDMRDIIKSHFSEAPVTSYNRRFDLAMLAQYGIYPNHLCSCLMLEATNILKLPGRYGDYKWPSLKQSWEHFHPGKEFCEKHRAGSDAQYAAEVALALAKGGHIYIPVIDSHRPLG